MGQTGSCIQDWVSFNESNVPLITSSINLHLVTSKGYFSQVILGGTIATLLVYLWSWISQNLSLFSKPSLKTYFYNQDYHYGTSDVVISKSRSKSVNVTTSIFVKKSTNVFYNSGIYVVLFKYLWWLLPKSMLRKNYNEYKAFQLNQWIKLNACNTAVKHSSMRGYTLCQQQSLKSKFLTFTGEIICLPPPAVLAAQ